MTDVRDSLTPVPLVGWEAVVSAVEPTSPPTRSRYRTIKNHGHSTDGVHVVRRGEARAAGSSTWHSVLSVLAAYARPTNGAVADQLVNAGSDLERKFTIEIKKFGQAGVRDDALNALSAATSQALSRISGWKDVVFAEAVIESMDARVAHLLGRTEAGEDAVVDVPRGLADHWKVSTGDAVYVLQRSLESSVVVTILPAAREGMPSEREAFLRSIHPERSEAEIDRLRQLAASGAVGRRTVRRAG
jgi:hypothetical protein